MVLIELFVMLMAILLCTFMILWIGLICYDSLLDSYLIIQGIGFYYILWSQVIQSSDTKLSQNIWLRLLVQAKRDCNLVHCIWWMFSRSLYFLWINILKTMCGWNICSINFHIFDWITVLVWRFGAFIWSNVQANLLKTLKYVFNSSCMEVLTWLHVL